MTNKKTSQQATTWTSHWERRHTIFQEFSLENFWVGIGRDLSIQKNINKTNRQKNDYPSKTNSCSQRDADSKTNIEINFVLQARKKTWASGKKEKQNRTPNELELELKLILQKIPWVFFIKKSFEWRFLVVLKTHK